MHMLVFYVFHCKTCRKRLQVDKNAPVFNKGMTYQTNQKDRVDVMEPLYRSAKLEE